MSGGEDTKPPIDTERYSYQRTGDSREKKMVDHLLLAAIVALVGAVWVLGRSVAVLQASDTFQNERITEIRTDVKELQGKTFRGVDGFNVDEERDASQRKP